MSTNELTSKVSDYKEFSAMIAELEAVKDAIADELKALLTNLGQDTLTVGGYKISYVDCFRKDVDKKALAAAHSEIYNKFLKESTYKRFTVA